MKKEKFEIQGMTCSSCQAHVQKAVSKLEGTQNVAVNLLSNNMVVEYNENQLDNNQIIQAVIDAGYGATLSNAEKKQSPKNKSEDTIKSMKKRLVWSLIFWVPLMYLAMHHMVYEWLGLPIPAILKNVFHGTENALTFGFAQFLLVLPIVYWNRNYFIVGFKKLWKKSPNMDSLIAIGATSAIVYGIYAIFQIGYGLGHGRLDLVQRFSQDLYFESAGTILTLITVGKYLETKSKGKTGDAIRKLIDLAPKMATLFKDGKEIEVTIEEIAVGDILLVRPGKSIPVDGEIIEGSSSIDQSSITGESIPVSKKVGDTVISGTINKNGSFKMKATKVGKDTTLSQIIQLVEEAGNSKAPIARIADQVSGVFVPIVITIAILATLFWIVQGQSFEFALSIGIAVLVISCPCALGLATPVAIMVGTGKAAENGILIKTAESLETLHLVDTVVLDKTGTITEGKPKVVEIVSEIAENELLQIVASLEQHSEHPLAEAIKEKAKEKQVDLVDVTDFSNIPGRGICGTLKEKRYLAGNRAFMEENQIAISRENAKARTVIYVANETELLGEVEIADRVKNDSLQAIQNLQKNHLEVVMLTGDNQAVANSIGQELGIHQVISEVLPQDKEREVQKLQQAGKKVAFVGDGINDSPALTRADVGLAIGSGTDIAIESADIVLMKNSLLDVVSAISLSKAVISNIKMNLFWAFFYNTVGIPIAAGALYLKFGIKLNPMIGALAMSLSSVCVVTNALRLRKFKPVGVDAHIDPKYNNNKEEKIMKKTIEIEGMQCNHCKMTVEKALSAIEGVTKVEVSLENKTATIEFTKEIDENQIKQLIEEAGFEVK